MEEQEVRAAQRGPQEAHTAGQRETPGPDGPEPGHPREAFRAYGPSNYFHGKQAEDA